jgi:hypothetical protein
MGAQGASRQNTAGSRPGQWTGLELVDEDDLNRKTQEAFSGLGRIVALRHRSSTLHQIHRHIRYLYF